MAGSGKKESKEKKNDKQKSEGSRKKRGKREERVGEKNGKKLEGGGWVWGGRGA